MNIILTNLSKFKKEAETSAYSSETGDIIGTQTNDAPVKYLVSFLHNKGETADKILAVTTKVAEDTYTQFCQMLAEYGEKTGIEIPVPEKIGTFETDISRTIQKITEKISVNDKVYIDTTGGFRNSSYLLMGVVRVLEYSDILLEKAVYSNNFEHKIEDVTDNYRMFDLINAVNTFTSVGNACELANYFKDFDDDVIKRTINAMNVFSDEITLCRTSKLNNVISELNSCLSELENVQSDSKDITLFKSLSKTIRSKFNIHDGEIEYPAIVRWCLDNRLIQQAVTVYVEKMPEYFYKKGYFKASESVKESVRNKNSRFDFHYDLFYSTLLQDDGMPEYVRILSGIAKNGKDENKNRFSRKTDEELIFNALNECNDISTFMSRVKGLKKYNFESMRTCIKHYFTVRNAIYENGEKRNVMSRNDKLKDFPNVISILKNYPLPLVPEKFLSSLMNNQKLVCAVFGISREYEDTHINFIENLENHRKTADFTLTDKMKTEEIQTMFRDILYAKNFVRNKLNHASEDENDKQEFRRYFEKYGYKTDSELSVGDISCALYKSIDNIKEIRK